MVTIEEILGGPRHGSLFRISKSPCRSESTLWVCLDPSAKHMSRQESDRAFGMVMLAFTLNKKVSVSVDKDKTTPACGGNFPTLNDIRILR